MFLGWLLQWFTWNASDVIWMIDATSFWTCKLQDTSYKIDSMIDMYKLIRHFVIYVKVQIIFDLYNYTSVIQVSCAVYITIKCR